MRYAKALEIQIFDSVAKNIRKGKKRIGKQAIYLQKQKLGGNAKWGSVVGFKE